MAYIKNKVPQSSIYQEDPRKNVGPLEKTQAGGIVGTGGESPQQTAKAAESVTTPSYTLWQHAQSTLDKPEYIKRAEKSLESSRAGLAPAQQSYIFNASQGLRDLSQEDVSGVAGGNVSATEKARSVVNPPSFSAAPFSYNLPSSFGYDVDIQSALEKPEDRGELRTPGMAKFMASAYKGNPYFKQTIESLGKQEKSLRDEASAAAVGTTEEAKKSYENQATVKSNEARQKLQKYLDDLTKQNEQEMASFNAPSSPISLDEVTAELQNQGRGGLARHIPGLDWQTMVKRTPPAAPKWQDFIDAEEASRWTNVANVLGSGGLQAGAIPTGGLDISGLYPSLEARAAQGMPVRGGVSPPPAPRSPLRPIKLQAGESGYQPFDPSTLQQMPEPGTYSTTGQLMVPIWNQIPRDAREGSSEYVRQEAEQQAAQDRTPSAPQDQEEPVNPETKGQGWYWPSIEKIFGSGNKEPREVRRRPSDK